MRALLSRSLAVAVATVLLAVVLAAPVVGSDYSHIKSFLFVWTATEADLPWIASRYDWVRLDANLVPPFRAFSAAPTWVYSNYNYAPNNGPRQDMRIWADANSLTWQQWEDMYLHFAVDTVHLPSAETSTPDRSVEDKFDTVWVYNGSSYANRTTDAYGGGAFAVGGGVGWILYIGYDEPFKEANLTLTTPASANWDGVWEYWNGSTWAALSPTDGTADMTASGKVEKVPPPMASWTRTTVNGVIRWWWRLRTTAAGTTQPVVAGGGLKGRNYYYPSGGYYRSPGWDSANDQNGDGVRDANVNPNATAILRYEARVPWWEHTTQYVNMANANVRRWYPSWHAKLVTSPIGGTSYTFDTLFLDDAMTAFLVANLQSGGATVEDTSAGAWQAATLAMLQATKSAVGPGKIVFINTSMYTDAVTESYIDAVDGFHGEGFIQAGGSYPRERLDAMTSRVAKGKWCQILAPGVAVEGDWERSKMTSLALFYLTSAANTYYEWGVDGYPGPFKQNWYAGIAYNVGQPKAPYYVLRQQDDPSCPHDQWGIAYMYAREFDNALVVSVPLPHWDSNYTASYTAALPAYTLPAGGTSNRYQRLNSDGTINPTILTTVTLRNAEGVILVKADLSPPAVTVSKSADVSQVAPGDVITYTITYRNDSSATVQNVILTDPIPEYTTYVSNSTKLNGSVVDPDPFVNDRVSVPIGSVPTGGSGTVVFQVRVR